MSDNSRSEGLSAGFDDNSSEGIVAGRADNAIVDAAEDAVSNTAAGVDGCGLVPFILLHGFAQSPRSWDDVAHVLRADGHATYVPGLMDANSDDGTLAEGLSWEEAQDVADEHQDAVEFGKEMIPQAYVRLSRAQCLADLCDATAELVSAVACAHQRPPVLVGYSMGGRIALETLVGFGQTLPLAGLVLESAALGPRDQVERTAFAERSQQWAARLQGGGIESFVDWWETLPLFETQQALAPDVRARVRADRVGCGVDKLVRMTKRAEQHRQSYAEESIAALNDACDHGLAVLYLTGANDMRYGDVADDLRQLSPQVDVRIISRAGHNIHLERPDAFIAALEEWTDAVAPGRYGEPGQDAGRLQDPDAPEGF